MSHAARMSSSRFSTLRPTSTQESESMAATTTSLPRPTVKTKPLPLRPSSASVVMTTYAEDNRGSLFIASEPDSVLDVGKRRS